MGCPGLIGVLLLLGQVPPPALGADAARELETAKRSIVAERGGSAQEPGRAIGQGRRSQRRRPDSRAAAPAGRPGWPDAVRAASRSGRGSSRGHEGGAVASEPRGNRVAIGPRAVQAGPACGQDRSALVRAGEPVPACGPRACSPIIGRRGGCWATCRMTAAGPGRSPCEQLRNGLVSHPTFGWVPADWVPHLDRGELPAPLARGQKKARWLSAAEAERPSSQLVSSLVHQYRTLRDPDQCHAGRGDHLRPPPRGVSRPVHGPVCRHSRRKPAAGPPLQRPVHDRRARLTNRTRSIISAPRTNMSTT